MRGTEEHDDVPGVHRVAGQPEGAGGDQLGHPVRHGSGHERIASPGCSDRTIRRRLTEWAGQGRQLLRLAPLAYDRMMGLDLDDLAVDGAITKAPCGGEVAGRSPVDRGKQGMKPSIATDGAGILLHLLACGLTSRPYRFQVQLWQYRRLQRPI